jgi:hypothetical protein
VKRFERYRIEAGSCRNQLLLNLSTTGQGQLTKCYYFRLRTDSFLELSKAINSQLSSACERMSHGNKSGWICQRERLMEGAHPLPCSLRWVKQHTAPSQCPTRTPSRIWQYHARPIKRRRGHRNYPHRCSTRVGCSGCGGRCYQGRTWSSRPLADRRRSRRKPRGSGRGLRRRRGS